MSDRVTTTFGQENRAVQNVIILSQILTAFLNFTISIVKTPQASKKSTSEKCLPILSLRNRRSGGRTVSINIQNYCSTDSRVLKVTFIRVLFGIFLYISVKEY